MHKEKPRPDTGMRSSVVFRGIRILRRANSTVRHLWGGRMDNWRKILNLCLALVGIIATAVFVKLFWSYRFDPVATALVVKNFAAIVGLPFAFVAAFIVIALFRQSETPLEFEGFGFKLKGAAGEIVLWAVCFLAITGSIALLWQH